MSQKNFWWIPLKKNPLSISFSSHLTILVKQKIQVKNQTASYWPGFIKSDRPKSVALRGESSFVDLKRKFYTKKCTNYFSSLVRNKLWNMIYQLLHELEVEHIQQAVQLLPQVSCHGEPNHVDGIQLQLWASVSLQSLHLSHYNGYPFWYRHMMQN